MSAPQQQQMNPVQQNLAIRQAIIYGGFGQPPAVNLWQALNPQVAAGTAPGSVLTVQLRNVGLVKRLLVKITATVTAGAVSAQNLTALGLANLVSNFTFTDLANNTRINTTGWHLVALSSVKRRRVWGSAATTDTPLGYGNIYNRTVFAPSSIAALGSSPIVMYYEVPFAFSDHDLRGIIFSDVTQAQMQLAITLNPGMFVASGADATSAMYQSAGADLATLSNVTLQVFQNYLDQGPMGKNPQSGQLVPLLPALDIGTAYMLNNTNTPLPVVNTDNGVAFTNARQFQSLTFIYDNAGTLNIGTDVNSFAVMSANLVPIIRYDPITAALFGRNTIGDDFPRGMYYFDFRDRPIDTNQYGNMVFIFNPSSVSGASATGLIGWESFGFIGLVNQGGSLPMAA